MFENLQNTVTRYIPPVLLFAVLSGAAAVASNEAINDSARGGVAGRAAISADLLVAGYVSEISQDLDKGEDKAAEAANRKMEAEEGISAAEHDKVDSDHGAERKSMLFAGVASAAAVGEVVVVTVRRNRKNKH